MRPSRASTAASDWRPKIAKLDHFPGVVAAAPYIEDQGMVTHGNKSSGFCCAAFSPTWSVRWQTSLHIF
jgi:ABC-type lipoprotein release transport system permease subunit